MLCCDVRVAKGAGEGWKVGLEGGWGGGGGVTERTAVL